MHGLYLSVFITIALFAISGDGMAGERKITDLGGSQPTVQSIVQALVSSPSDTDSIKGRNLAVVSVERSIMLNVSFANNSAVVDPSGRRVLDVLAEALRTPELSGRSFRVEGHANRTGDEGYNDLLTMQRAFAVVGYLTSRKVVNGRLSAVGFGFRQPLPGTDPSDGRNRRVEIVTVP